MRDSNVIKNIIIMMLILTYYVHHVYVIKVQYLNLGPGGPPVEHNVIRSGSFVDGFIIAWAAGTL
jgi:hypothetical protein